MIENLKNAIFNISDFEYINFVQDSTSIKFIYQDVIVYGYKDSISVFYDDTEMGVLTQLKFINKENSLKTFSDISNALSYMYYLSRVTSDIRYTLYHYFLHRLKEIEFNYTHFSFGLVGSYRNYSKDNRSIRCDFEGLSIMNKKVRYNCLIIFNNDGSCKFSFYPEDPEWNEEKICPKREVDKIIEYILNLKVDNYEDIPLIES
ncbi:hypothetical protein NZD88_09060 [Chryseobacterium antibioticum]|uniref:Uncharacterized protein n=1 Tax=Chryseobacterium pyrolae TaxID=2987481 RepID=A0ABT2IGG7_9FLAO|nr:hypothetical protein [Chryseobacterium pyrolae]MCT2407684.1 hypothetical protein [Chryseobacterium pyrolae]